MRILISILVAGAACAQTAPRQQPGEDIGPADIIVTTKFVIAPVTVLDKNGKQVTGLTPLDFRLYDNGKLQVITEDQANHPISLAVAIQATAPTLRRFCPRLPKPPRCMIP